MIKSLSRLIAYLVAMFIFLNTAASEIIQISFGEPINNSYMWIYRCSFIVTSYIIWALVSRLIVKSTPPIVKTDPSIPELLSEHIEIAQREIKKYNMLLMLTTDRKKIEGYAEMINWYKHRMKLAEELNIASDRFTACTSIPFPNIEQKQ